MGKFNFKLYLNDFKINKNKHLQCKMINAYYECTVYYERTS